MLQNLSKNTFTVVLISLAACFSFNAYAAAMDSSNFLQIRQNPESQSSNNPQNAPQQVREIYSTQSTFSQPTNSDFASLPKCPNSPYDYANGVPSRFEYPPACPDINDNMPPVTNITFREFLPNSASFRTGNFRLTPQEFYSNRNAYCPNLCTVTQHVIRDASNDIVGIRRAICPDGYTQVAAFNTQPEVIKVTQAINVDPPILWSDFTKFRQNGYECSLADSLEFYDWVQQNQCPKADSSAYNIYASRVTVGGVDQIDSAGPPTQNSSGIAGRYVPQNRNSGLCYLDNAPGKCDVRAAGDHPGNAGCDPASIYRVLLDYKFVYMKCEAPAGSYITTNYTAPASVVCARAQDRWSDQSAPDAVEKQR